MVTQKVHPGTRITLVINTASLPHVISAASVSWLWHKDFQISLQGASKAFGHKANIVFRVTFPPDHSVFSHSKHCFHTR